MTFPLLSYIVWGSTAVGQAVLLSRGKRLPAGLRIYLTAQIALTLVGLPTSLLDPPLFLKVWRFSNFADDVLTAVVVLAIYNDARLRARPKYQGPGLLAVIALLLLAASVFWSRQPLPTLSGSFMQMEFTMSHIWWTWLNILCGTIPLYCLVSGAALNRKLLLLLSGIGLYLFVRAGVIDYLITTRFRHHLSAGLFSTAAYFFTLALWFLSSCSSYSSPRTRKHPGNFT